MVFLHLGVMRDCPRERPCMVPTRPLSLIALPRGRVGRGKAPHGVLISSDLSRPSATLAAHQTHPLCVNAFGLSLH
eukprot:5311250-Amphidinium_carterae.2